MNTLGRDSCSSLVFHTKEAEASSIVSEWGLVCDMNYKSKVVSESLLYHDVYGTLFTLNDQAYIA